MNLDENTNAHFDLVQIDPRATLIVMIDVVTREGGFTRGEDLREHWESPRIQRVSSNYACPSGWYAVTCPDHKNLFIKFTSTRFQLLDESDQPQGAEIESKPDMTIESTTATAESAPAPKHQAPPKKTKAPAKVKPVKASTKVAAKKAANKPAKTATGNYKWLLRRLKAQALGALSTDSNRATLREGMKDLDSFTKVRSFLNRAGVKIETFDTFLDKFFDAAIDR